MSAHHVSNDLINFLLAAAMQSGRHLKSVRTASFSWNRRNGKLETLNPENVQPTGQMLLEENAKSIAHRLERQIPPPEIPSLTFPTTRLVPTGQPRLAEILKAADYYEHNTSQHPGWWESDAREFIECLRRVTWMSTPEYHRAVWGEPAHVRSYYQATPAPEGPVQSNPPTDWSRVRSMADLPHAPGMEMGGRERS